jgi:hypothetical protein
MIRERERELKLRAVSVKELEREFERPGRGPDNGGKFVMKNEFNV